MCGIAGILTCAPEAHHDAFVRMSAALEHRGPDSRGQVELQIAPNGPALLLAQRRLAILDLSPGGHQPMSEPLSGAWMVYNGETYNFRLLREELAARGLSFHTQCDTEVVLKAYALWGCDFLQKLRGMYALAIYDPRDQTILLARDRVGIKPLYYALSPRPDVHLIFASEVRALLASGLVPRRLSPPGLSCYLAQGYVADPLTIIDGVESLLPAHLARIDATTGRILEQRPYWSRSRTAVYDGNGRSPAAHLREVLEQTVALHMISDAPLGAFLSGGVDSSTLVALMSRISGRPIRTFSLVFDDPLSEEPYSDAVAHHFRTDHHKIRVSPERFLDSLDDSLAATDQPTTDAINSCVVSRECRGSGLTVAIAGTGGDELFGGYTSFRTVPRAMRLLRAYRSFPRWLRRRTTPLLQAAIAGRDPHLPSAGKRGKLAKLLELEPDDLAVYHLSRCVLLPEMCTGLLAKPVIPGESWGVPARLENLIRADSACLPDRRQRVSVYEQAFYMCNQLLRDTDAASMSVALEVRVPFLDHVVIETVAGMNPSALFAGKPKSLLLEAVRDILPQRLLNPRKQGFVLPIGTWLRGPLSSRVTELLTNADLSAAAGLNPAALSQVWDDYRSARTPVFYTRVWGLFVLLDWCQRYDVAVRN